jgi:hypothetical protein
MLEFPNTFEEEEEEEEDVNHIWWNFPTCSRMFLAPLWSPPRSHALEKQITISGSLDW